MRLLYIITQGECGGAQKQVLDLAIYMHKIGHKVFVATGRQESLSDNWLFDNLKQAGFKKSDLFIVEDLQREIKIKKDGRAFFLIYQLVKNTKPHIVHVHSTKAGILASLAAKIAGSRVIYTVHGFVFSEPMDFLKKIFYVLAEFIASFFRDQTIVVSEADFDQGKKYKILRGGRGVVIYNGLDENLSSDILDKESARRIICAKAGIFEKEAIIIGVVANLYKTKGIEYLIEAAEKINFDGGVKPYFVVIGEGELRAELERKISDYKMNKSFFLIGSIPQAYRFLKAFDLVALPSVKEGFPYILLEATLADVPIVATHVGGIPELSKYTSIFLVNPADSSSLAKTITSTINSVKANGKSSDGKGLHIRLTLSSMTGFLLAEYERILGYSLQNPICSSFLLTVPCFNEESIIRGTLSDIHEYLSTEFNDLIQKNRLRCCVAINGATDKTKQAVLEIIRSIPYLTYTSIKEKGRGRALFNLWKNSNEDVFVYVDADLAYSLKDVGSMISSYLRNENYDLVIASRRISGSFVTRHPLRKILTEGYNYLIKVLFWNDFTDAQAGCKSITRSAFSRIRVSLNNYPGWFFDTALLLYAENNGARIKDLPITCIDNRKWRLRIIGAIFYFIKNLLTLRIKTFLWGWASRSR